MRRLAAALAGLVLTLAAAGSGLAAESGGEPFRLRRIAVDPHGGGDAALAPDGDSFVTSSRRDGDWDLWLYEIGNGRWRQLTDDPAEDFEAQWSPSGDRLVFTSTRHGHKDVFLLRLADRALARLTSSGEDEEYPRFAPDGRSIVYTAGPWGRNRFYVVELDDTGMAAAGPAAAVGRPGLAGACSFGPTPGELTCHRYERGHGDLVRIHLATGAETALTSGPEWDYKPAPSPDGRWIAFSRGHEGPSEVWVMPAGGGTPRRLTRGGGSDRWPVWSGAGDAIFFHRAVSRGTGVHRLDLARGRVERLVGPGERPLQADLDPSGHLLAYCRRRAGGGHEIRIRDLERGVTRTLGHGAGEACWPRFLPAGDRLAFALKHGARWEIATARLDGGGLEVWTEEEPALRGLDGPLDVAPDGRSVLFQGDTEPFASDLYRLSLDDGSVTDLTRDRWFDEAPAFTADGRGVLFMSTRGGSWTWGLYRLGLDDGSVAVVAPPDYTEKNHPRAGPDGAVVWTRRDGDGTERLVELAAGAAAPAELPAGGRWPSYAAGGEAVIFTTVEETVELWLAEHPFGPGSPLSDPAAAPPAPLDGLAITARAAAVASPAAAPVGRGPATPIDLFHR